jgi:hypothetical protein
MLRGGCDVAGPAQARSAAAARREIREIERRWENCLCQQRSKQRAHPSSSLSMFAGELLRTNCFHMHCRPDDVIDACYAYAASCARFDYVLTGEMRSGALFGGSTCKRIPGTPRHSTTPDSWAVAERHRGCRRASQFHQYLQMLSPQMLCAAVPLTTRVRTAEPAGPEGLGSAGGWGEIFGCTSGIDAGTSRHRDNICAHVALTNLRVGYETHESHILGPLTQRCAELFAGVGAPTFPD